MLADHINAIITNPGATSNEELSDTLDLIVLLSNKLAFINYHKRHLAKRLLNPVKGFEAKCLDLEKAVISRLPKKSDGLKLVTRLLGDHDSSRQFSDQLLKSEELEQRRGLDAVDIYRLSEVMGPGVGSEFASTKDGPTIWEDHFLPEIIDGETGAVLPDGELGELVFTSLTKTAFPVLRYRTRDLSRLLPGSAQPTMRRIEKITGRNDDMIILRGVNLFPTQIEEIAIAIEHLTPHFILELVKRGRMDGLVVKIECDPGVKPVVATAAAEILKLRVKERIGTTVDVEIVPAGSLPRSEGKYKRVYDLR
jgi:acyl-CoA synthetase (AMP-forming)/AMP-acid ligase II